MKLSVKFKLASLFNQFEFYRQNLPKHAPECFKQVSYEGMSKTMPQKLPDFKRQRLVDLLSAQQLKKGPDET